MPEWNGPAILLVDLDAFFASVEQLDHPDWRGKPVIVGGDPTKRGVVSTASYEARKFGVHSAMPSSTAARLCPDAIWTHGRHDRYKEMSQKVMEILLGYSPHLIQVSIDEAFLDVSPTRVNRTHPVIVAQQIQCDIDALGVTCSIGLGTSKPVSKIASDQDKPHGLTVVYPGHEREFLFPLPTKVMSGIGPVAQKQLKEYGIRTLQEVAEADQAVLKKVFGKNATMMRNRALGIDSALRDEPEPVKSVSNEISVAESVDTRHDIEALIATMAHKVGRRLRKKGLEGTTLHLKIRYENLKIRTCQRKIANLGTNELVWLPQLYDMLDEIWSPGVLVRLVGVGVSGFDPEAVQEQLFGLVDEQQPTSPLLTEPEKKAALLDARDLIADKFGERSLQFGHEFTSLKQTTNSSSKNPGDYLDR
ncbi:DNA polymerase IV [Anaerotardibacter muris]|uniref:DNA polymerase IV n=1 Tax=Anaerotardibacter muris TaxID=2941505 RepID=UPI0030840133